MQTQVKREDKLETKVPKCSNCGQYMTEKSQDDDGDETYYWLECLRCGNREE